MLEFNELDNKMLLMLLILAFSFMAVWTLIIVDEVEKVKAVQITQNKINAEFRADIAKFKKRRRANVTVTAYSPRVKETDSTPTETAFLTPVSARSVALPWSLIQQGWIPGNCIYLKIDSYKYGGIYKINDLMADYWTDRADLFFWDTRHAIKFGVLYNIDMIYLGECP